jgi:hypothetical protein
MMELTRHQDVETRLAELSSEAPPGTFSLQVRELTRELLEGGFEREELLEIFEHFRSDLREMEREEQEDELLDVMDQLDGWCSPHTRL